MKASRRLLLMFGTAVIFLAGIGFQKLTLAQPQQGSDWVAEQAGKLPPDIHPETLSRAARPKESDFTSAEDKEVFDRENNRPGSKQLFAKWLGPTGTRLQIPELAAVYQQQIGLIQDAMTKNGVDNPTKNSRLPSRHARPITEMSFLTMSLMP